MNYREPARTAGRRTRWTIVAALAIVGAAIVGAAIVGVLDYHSSAASAPSATSSPTVRTTPRARPSITVVPLVPSPQEGLQSDPYGPAGAADGVVPEGVTVFDNTYPAVTKLNPALLVAVRRAASDAAGSGITFYVNSGWRSPKYQEQLLQEAITKYGSEKAAARWVATPDTSAHVSGNAVDIGRSAAVTWLSAHGSAYGLCQIYRNEAWHFELRPAAISHGCPAMYADPTQDPRMNQ